MLDFINTSLDDKSLALKDIINSLSTNPIFNGRLNKNISVLSSVDTVINHGLGRVPNGYLITKKLAFCDLKFVSSNTLTITVRTSVSTTIDLWVF
jgi:hypothetical protein